MNVELAMNLEAVEDLIGAGSAGAGILTVGPPPLRLADVLLSGFQSHNFRPLFFHGRESVAGQLKEIADAASRETRRAIKAAVAIAISEWQLHPYGETTLVELAGVVAQLRVSEAIPVLDERLEQIATAISLREDVEDAELQREHRRLSGAHSQIVAVIAGFIPEPDAVQAAVGLFDRSKLPYRSSASLFIELARCQLEKLPVRMYAFGAILDEHPNYFDTEAIWSEFIGVVGETRLVEQILEMSDDDAVWLLGKLNRPDLTRRVRRQRPTLPRPRYERMDAIHRELTPADETYRSTSLVRVPRPGRRTPRQPGGSDTYRVNVEALAPDLRSEYQSRGVYRELEEQRP